MWISRYRKRNHVDQQAIHTSIKYFFRHHTTFILNRKFNMTFFTNSTFYISNAGGCLHRNSQLLFQSSPWDFDEVHQSQNSTRVVCHSALEIVHLSQTGNPGPVWWATGHRGLLSRPKIIFTSYWNKIDQIDIYAPFLRPFHRNPGSALQIPPD